MQNVNKNKINQTKQTNNNNEKPKEKAQIAILISDKMTLSQILYNKRQKRHYIWDQFIKATYQ